jgi:elongation factor P--(R)-beta-lysine ligase
MLPSVLTRQNDPHPQAEEEQPTWRPSASIEILRRRAALIARIRHFFAEHAILEVETPAMSQASVTDLHLRSFQTHLTLPGSLESVPLYFITSPEFHMKRLLAAGSGPIFQLSRSFRNEECGDWHNPEFTLLEWYQFGDLSQLMARVEQLLMMLLGCQSAERLSYQQLFQRVVGLDPLTADRQQLQAAMAQYPLSLELQQEQDQDTLLQLLFSVAIEPQLERDRPLFITDFPASQAALAQINPQDSRVAERFELYYQGFELANGFHELRDAEEQQRRFQQDNQQRQREGLPPQPIDHRLLAALQHGLPDCSGVALGVDRLLMLACGETRIQSVMAFATPIA